MRNFTYNTLLTLLLTLGYSFFAKGQPFVHPGLLNSNEDLARMKNGVDAKIEPIYSGYQVFRDHPQSKADYKMQGPLATVGRNPTIGAGVYDADANAAYQNALMWCITGNSAYADKAKEILNAWCATLKTITGRDAVLMAGLGPFKMVNAAELLRYTNSGWADADIKQAELHFKTVIYPVLKEFAPFANGNWDSAALKTVMAIAIFCNDRQMYDDALKYYIASGGDGSLTNYIINEDGQCQESGRDQGHTQLGIAHLGDCCEMAWHQGLDLYAWEGNRLLKGFEYTAKFNLGNDVPYVPEMDRTGKYLHAKISNDGRGRLRPVYEQIYNHYVNRMGMQAPFTQQAAEKIRPELQGQPGADHPGFGTLLYSIPETAPNRNEFVTAPAAPAGLVGNGFPDEVRLKWIAPIGAETYNVERSTKAAGTFLVIAKGIKGNYYSDHKVEKGRLYYYRIEAVNRSGSGVQKYPTSVCAGMPTTWGSRDIGNCLVKGTGDFDGESYTLTASGASADSASDQVHFLYIPKNGDVTITARYVPQVTSQLTRFGLMVRSALDTSAADVSLLVDPESTGQIEAPAWDIKLTKREGQGKKSILIKKSDPLGDPVVTYSRLTGICWLRLERRNNMFIGYWSSDGKQWNEVGRVDVPISPKCYAGMFACSGLKTVTTIVKFDHVDVSK